MGSLSRLEPVTMRRHRGGGNSTIASPGFRRTASESLADRLRRRDRTALEELYDAYSGRAFGLAYHVLNDGPAAEDAVHDAFLWFWEHAERLDGARGNAGALLLTITRRRAIDQLRRHNRQDGHSLDGRVSLDPVDEQALEILGRIEDSILAEHVHEAVSRLSPEQREVLELAYFQGLTQNEISVRQQLPIGTVKSRLRLGLQKLRNSMRVEGIR